MMKHTRRTLPRTPFILAASAAAMLGFLAEPASAQERVWNLAPGSGTWNTAGNWTAPNVPNAAGESARFQLSNITTVNISASVSPDGILFDAGASAFTINKSGGVALNLNGFGIVNDSGVLQTINNNGAGSRTVFNNSATGDSNVHIRSTGAGSFTTFNDTSSTGDGLMISNNGTASALNFNDDSTAGNNAVLNNNGTVSRIVFNDNSHAGNNAAISNIGLVSTTTFNDFSSATNAQIANSAGSVIFNDNSTAAVSTITNSGLGTSTLFNDDSTAGAATINNNGAVSFVIFSDDSNAGTATITNTATGSFASIRENASGGQARVINTVAGAIFDISLLTSTGTTLGSIAGGGNFYLGSKNLEVGGNNESTLVFGVLRDRGPLAPNEIGGSLTKVGTGTMNLTGVNLYTGATTINGGSLLVNGSTISAETIVNQLGLLGGSGSIGGNVINRGTVSPGNSPGTLTVTGNYLQESTGNFRLEIASTSQFDRLSIGGTATLNGKVTAVGVDGYKPKRGDVVTFLTTGGGVLGQFSELDADGISDGTILDYVLRYGQNDVSLAVVQGSFAALDGLTINQKAVAKALDKVAFGTTVPKVIDYLDTRPIGDLPGDFDRIAPEEIASIFNIAYSLSNIQMTNLSRRMDEVRGGASGFSGRGFALQGNLPEQGTTGFAGTKGLSGKDFKDSKDAKEAKVIPTAPEQSRWGFFVSGAGEFVDIESTGNAKGYDFQSGGITLGVDYRVCENFAVGLTAGYAHTGVDLTGQGSIGVDAGRLGLYATGFVGGFYVDAAVSGGYGSYDVRRSALQGSAYGDTTAGELDTYVGLGYDFKVGALTFGPIANFQYTYVDLDGFNEHGSLAPLTYSQQSNESLRTTLGLKASYDVKCHGRLIRPTLRVAWQHEFGDSAAAVTSALASGGSDFTVYGPNIGDDALLVGAGFTVQISERASAFLFYDGEFFRTNYQLNAISGGVRLEF